MDVAAALARWHDLVHEGVEAGEPTRLPDLVAEHAVFRSPAVHTPAQGRDAVVAYLSAALRVLGPVLAYHREWLREDSAVLEFTSEVGGMSLHGVDMVTWDDAGLIADFTVMVRPVKGLHALMEAMAAELG